MFQELIFFVPEVVWVPLMGPKWAPKAPCLFLCFFVLSAFLVNFSETTGPIVTKLEI